MKLFFSRHVSILFHELNKLSLFTYQFLNIVGTMDPSEWKKPSEVMKVLRRRKSVSQRRITADSDKRTSVIYKSPSKSVKRKNPFHTDSPHPFPAKRQNVCTEVKSDGEVDSKDALSCQLFTLLETANDNEEEVIINWWYN